MKNKTVAMLGASVVGVLAAIGMSRGMHSSSNRQYRCGHRDFRLRPNNRRLGTHHAGQGATGKVADRSNSQGGRKPALGF